MKRHNERKDFLVSAWVSFDLKKKIYEIAAHENTTVSDIARRCLEKGVSEYEEVKGNGN